LNDLEDFLENHNVTGLLTISQDIENIMNVYMNIFLLLYADDTVLMAETPEDLQKQLNILIERLWNFPLFRISYIALVPLSASVLIALLKFPVFVNNKPK
jgi:hypothetical protein